MSFLGSIGSVMKGSGLSDALETTYGSNAVTHMLSGKAVARALRGHFLIEAALMTKLIAPILPRTGAQIVEKENNEEIMVPNESESSSKADIEDEINDGSEEGSAESFVHEAEYSGNKLTDQQMEKLRSLCESDNDSPTATEEIIASEEIGMLEKYLNDYTKEL